MSKLENYSFKSKMNLFVLLAFIFLFISNGILIKYTKKDLIKKAEEQLTIRAKSYCYLLANNSENRIKEDRRTKDGPLYDMVRSLINSQGSKSNGQASDIEYIILLNNENKVLMHSDHSRVGQILSDIMTDFASMASQFGYKKYSDENIGDIYDYFKPVYSSSNDTNNNKLGYVRVGLRLSQQKQIDDVIFSYQITLLLFFVLSITLAILLLERLAAPIKHFVQSADPISHGDLTKSTDIKTSDELQTLSEYFDKLAQNYKAFIVSVTHANSGIKIMNANVENGSQIILNGAKSQSKLIEKALNLIGNINVSVKGVFKNLEHLSGFTRENLVVSNNIRKQNAAIVNSIENMDMYVQETIEPIKDVFTSIERVSGNVNKLSDLSSKASSHIEVLKEITPNIENAAKEAVTLSEAVTKSTSGFGLESVQNSLEGMQKIKSSVRTAAEVVDRLGNRTIEIDRILTVINEIAEQTNLLALNAAILASEAGEHGKGFNVVATEIRELSERTAISTKEIDKLIKNVISEVNEANNVMNQCSKYVYEGERSSHETNEALTKVLETSKQALKQTKLIEEEASKQTDEIHKTKGYIDSIAANVKSLKSDTVKQHEKGVNMTKDAADRLKKKTTDIQQSISQQTKHIKKISAAIGDYSQMIDNILSSIVQHAGENENLSGAIKEIELISAENLDVAKNLIDIYKKAVSETEKIDIEVAKYQVVEQIDE